MARSPLGAAADIFLFRFQQASCPAQQAGNGKCSTTHGLPIGISYHLYLKTTCMEVLGFVTCFLF